ncbi:MFS general substrate transporter [Eremomyces bilateralis CBS 781.70]|uniref:MFS general substrate transporter n=1 Tax=Eremomyces bilateralis CBS 781.70 TaxID=1392243 RepID=A0A6G1FXI7_9PEZI|nr:MFS general substrate transporter [Eremomyces bilateralis CBS 781.70]KAF1810494.1 MFS general substrate transporter [Eremomyces bilateralis CBS 781.70]
MLYRAVGYDGVFGVGVAVLAIDFLLRLLVIERKVAMQYGIVDDEENERVCESLDDTDETPLLERQVEIEEQEFRIAPISSRIVSTVPILACMKNSSLLTAFFLAAVQALFLGAFDATVPTTAERYFGFDSLKSGLLFLPLSAMDLLVGPFAGRLVDRKGSKVVAVVGYSVLVPGHILLRLVQPQADGTDQVALYFCLLACIGIGMGIINAPAVTEASSVVEKYFKFNPTVFGGKSPYAQLYSINSMLFSLGLTVGPVLAGCLTKAINYGNMNAILAGVSALAAVLSYRYLRGGVPKRNHCK